MPVNRLTICDARTVDVPLIKVTSQSIGGPYLVVSGNLIDLLSTRIRVAVNRGRCRGWCASVENRDTALLLAGIWVSPKRNGIGRALVADLLEQTDKAIVVETTDDNVTAQKFYESLGFTLIQRVEGGFQTVLKIKGLDYSMPMHGQSGRMINDVLVYRYGSVTTAA